jgi:hypothetical protein
MLEKIRTFPTSPSDEQIAYALKRLTYARLDNWLDTDLNTLGWWFQAALTVLSIVVWWKLVDKKRLMELTFYCFTVMTITIWFDQVGYELGLWYYPVDLIPVFPPSTAIDYFMMPIIYGLVYQYCRTWKSFILATCLLSGVFSFVLEPLLEKFGFYVVIKWKYYYGFPIYIGIALIMKAIVEKIKVVMTRHQGLAAK